MGDGLWGHGLRIWMGRALDYEPHHPDTLERGPKADPESLEKANALHRSANAAND